MIRIKVVKASHLILGALAVIAAVALIALIVKTMVFDRHDGPGERNQPPGLFSRCSGGGGSWGLAGGGFQPDHHF